MGVESSNQTTSFGGYEGAQRIAHYDLILRTTVSGSWLPSTAVGSDYLKSIKRTSFRRIMCPSEYYCRRAEVFATNEVREHYWHISLKVLWYHLGCTNHRQAQ
jgi:hypothetical protein